MYITLPRGASFHCFISKHRDNKLFPLSIRSYFRTARNKELHSEIGIGYWSSHFIFRVNDVEDDIYLSIALGLVSLHFSCSRIFNRLNKFLRKKYKYDARGVYLAAHNASIWWELWVDPYSWSSTTPRWRHGNFNFADAILGEIKFSDNVIKTFKDIPIPMPEKAYLADIAEREIIHSRPRWFTKRYKSYMIDMQEPIPFPGKGESSWNCGDDALHSMSTPATDLASAIAAVVKSVIRDRLKNGGMTDLNWVRASVPCGACAEEQDCAGCEVLDET